MPNEIDVSTPVPVESLAPMIAAPYIARNESSHSAQNGMMTERRGRRPATRPDQPPTGLLCPTCALPLAHCGQAADTFGIGNDRWHRFTCSSCGDSFEYRRRAQRRRVRWKCPACQMLIRNDGDAPSPPVYRCHVCRVELVPDERGQRLVVARLNAASENEAEG